MSSLSSTPRIAKLVCFGQGGDSVEYGSGCSGSGYGTPENPHAANPGPDCIIPDGTPAIDKRAAVDTDAGDFIPALALTMHANGPQNLGSFFVIGEDGAAVAVTAQWLCRKEARRRHRRQGV